MIESCDYDGHNRRIIAKNLQHPYGVSVTRHQVYWTDWKTRALHALDKKNISAKRVVRDGLHGLMDVKVVEVCNDGILGSIDRWSIHSFALLNVLLQETRGPKVTNVCGRNNGNCSDLCLRTPKGFTCKCPTGILMKEGSKNECKPYPEVQKNG